MTVRVGTSYEKEDLKNCKSYPELVPSKGKHLAIQEKRIWLAERFRAKLPVLFGENMTTSFKVMI